MESAHFCSILLLILLRFSPIFSSSLTKETSGVSFLLNRPVAKELTGYELTLAKALGVGGVQQDLQRAIALSNSLILQGNPTAHFTLGLLMSHNLTGSNLPEKERLEQAFSHYVLAALNGDPLAQIVVGERYSSRSDCDSALYYLRRAAMTAVQSVPESAVSRPSIVRYISPDDNPLSSELPTVEELEYFKYLVWTGDSDAALKVAFLHYSEIPGIKYSLSETEKYLKIAAEGGNSAAMVWLANMYLLGELKGSDEDAKTLLEEALLKGDNSSYAGLARIYIEGRANVTKNITKAESYLKIGAENGAVGSLYLMGILYEELQKPPEWIETAWLPSSLIGHVHSAWKLGEHYRKRHQQAVSKSIVLQGDSNHFCKAALPFHRIAALAGEWKGLFQVAYEDHLNGKDSSALLQYLLLSDLGYPAAHVNAARLLESTEHEFYDPTSAAKVAFEMWKRVSAEGVAIGYLKMGNYYYYGNGEMPANMKESLRNYKKASILGSTEASFNVAWMTQWGLGLTRDITSAKIRYGVLLNDSEAYIPTILALTQLHIIEFANETFEIDFSTWNSTELLNEFHNIIVNVNTLFNKNWDLMAIALLILIISVSLYFRR